MDLYNCRHCRRIYCHAVWRMGLGSCNTCSCSWVSILQQVSSLQLWENPSTAKAEHSTARQAGLVLRKKFCILLMVVVGVRIDILIGTNYIRDAVCISFCLNELLSIVENTTLMGVPYPPVFKKAIDVLQTKVGRMEETTDKEESDHGNSET